MTLVQSPKGMFLLLSRSWLCYCILTRKAKNLQPLQLRDAYEKTRDYFKEMNNFGEHVSIVEIDENQRFFDENFEKFNFPFENKGSFTVNIEDYLADTWQACITNILGEPKVAINPHGTECDRSWKVSYTQEKTINITIHIYKKPKKQERKQAYAARQQSINVMLLCVF